MIGKKYHKIISFIIFCVTLIVSLLGIFLPGTLMNTSGNLKENQVSSVPEIYYSASKTAMARNNSQKMKTSEKLQLIMGKWESTISKVANYEMPSEKYEVVKLARDGIKVLYEKGIYPNSITLDYGDWYTWDADCYKAVDAIFHTYTVYYWIVNFRKYDSNENHIVYILEDGTVFLAKAQYEEPLDITKIVNAASILDNEMEPSEIDTSREKISDWVVYPNADTAGMKWKALTSIMSESDKYSIVQAYSDKQYLYSYMPAMLD